MRHSVALRYIVPMSNVRSRTLKPSTSPTKPSKLLYALTFFGHRSNEPRKYLVDARKFPLEAPATTDLAKAMKWTARHSPYRFIREHPELRGVCRPVPVDPVAA